MRKPLLLLAFLFFSLYSFSQWDIPNPMNQFCAGGGSLTFPNVGNGAGAGNMGPVNCLGSTPNPSWYYIQISSPGDLVFNISQQTNDGVPIDVDFALWGPFSSINVAINTIQANPNNPSLIDCSYSSLPQETATINGANTGDIYVFLMTNYDGRQGQISLTQVGGTSSTSCEFICGVSLGRDIASCHDSHTLHAVFNAESPDLTGVSYEWTFNGTVLPETSSTLEVIQEGEYSVTAQLPNCFEPAVATINVLLNQPLPIIDFDDIETCEGENINFQRVASDYTQQHDVSITMYNSQEDAENNTNPLTANFIAEQSQTIYVRVANRQFLDCFSITSFELIVYPNPVIEMEDVYELCLGDVLTIADLGDFDTYQWSTGDTGTSLAITRGGNYSLTVTLGMCSAVKQFTVLESEKPTISNIIIKDFSLNQNTIEVIAYGIGDYEYSLDGINFQDSPLFENVDSGTYLVTVKDKNGCGIASEYATVLMYPKFFTPNGDGFNDFWQIKYAFVEPNMQLFIFDRFGKLIHFFKGRERGWDGTYNGKKLPSTDYWFIIKRESGQEIKGHFSMVR